MHIRFRVWIADVSERQKMWGEWKIFDERYICKRKQ